MMTSTPVIRIGRARAIRIPDGMLEAIGSPDVVDLELYDGALVLRPIHHARSSWDDPARWANAELDGDDREWLEANLDPSPKEGAGCY